MERELMFMLAIWVADFNALVRRLFRSGDQRLGGMSSRSVDMPIGGRSVPGIGMLTLARKHATRPEI